ncbi:MAG: hypothetical protein HZA31_06605 [Opitutae bacterium]|nr:hypothetical protein [Opitutae bacterium]
MNLKYRSIISALSLGAVLANSPALLAGDLLIVNPSFEAGTLSSWTNFGSGDGGRTADNTEHASGSWSAKIVDNNTTQDFGLESTRFTATVGTGYAGFASVKVMTGSTQVALVLRFLNGSGTSISQTSTTVTGATSGWVKIKTPKLTAPSGAAYVSLLLYSNGAATSTAYWDDVMISKEFTDLGSPVRIATLHAATFSNDGATIYAAQDGVNNDYTNVPGKLKVINVNTGAITNSYTLTGSAVCWAAATAADGKVYFGSANTGRLYKFTPPSTLTDLGVVLNDTYIWDLTSGASGDKVFGGTFGGTTEVGKFFKYDGAGGISEIQPSNRPADPEAYVRSVAYDSVNNVSYLGTGSATGRLIWFNNATGAHYDILPSGYPTQGFVLPVDYRVSGGVGRVFAGLKGGTRLVLNVTVSGGVPTATVVRAMTTGSTVSPVYNGKVYFTILNVLYSYEIATDTLTNLNINLGMTPYRFGISTALTAANFSGGAPVLIGIGQDATKRYPQMFRYNINSGVSDFTDVLFDEVGVEIRSMTKGPDGKIYCSGYLNGNIGVYTPMCPPPGGAQNVSNFFAYQAEGMTTLNNKVYFGCYTRARVFEYDPSMTPTWSVGTNPVQKLYLNTTYLQDRPFGFTGDPASGKVFIGCVPEAGTLTGSFTVYTQSNGTSTTLRPLDPTYLDGYSIVSLAYYNGYVYGGTSIWGGVGATTTQTEAKFFRYNVSTGAVNVYPLPVSDIQVITGVTAKPSEGRIYFWGEGHLFNFNTATGTMNYNGNVFPDVTYTSGQSNPIWHSASMLLGKDDKIYGTIGGRLIRINSTVSIDTLISGSADHLAQDDYGNFYYAVAHVLYRYVW